MTVLLLGYEIQEFIDRREYEKIIHKMENYKKPEKKVLLNNYFEKHERRILEKAEWMKQILNMYEGLETIKEEWGILLADSMKIMHGESNLKAILVSAGLTDENETEEEQSKLFTSLCYVLSGIYALLSGKRI